MNLKTFRAVRSQRKLVRSNGPPDSPGGALNTKHTQQESFYNATS